MAIRRLDKDPRSRKEKKADQEALKLFEQGKFLAVKPSVERKAIKKLMNRHKNGG